MKAGKLRHRIRIDQQVQAQDPVTLEATTTWQMFAEHVPADIVPLSGRDFIAGGGKQSETTARIEIRMLDGLVDTMRAVNEVTGTIYTIVAVLPDRTNARHQNLMVGEGVSDGR